MVSVVSLTLHLAPCKPRVSRVNVSFLEGSFEDMHRLSILFFSFSLICPPYGDRTTSPVVVRGRSCDDYMIRPRCMVLNMVYGGAFFCFISPWFSLTFMLDDFFFCALQPCAAFREVSRQRELCSSRSFFLPLSRVQSFFLLVNLNRCT